MQISMLRHIAWKQCYGNAVCPVIHYTRDLCQMVKHTTILFYHLPMGHPQVDSQFLTKIWLYLGNKNNTRRYTHSYCVSLIQERWLSPTKRASAAKINYYYRL